MRKIRRSERAGGRRARRFGSMAFTVVAGIVLLLVFALVFSIAYGTRRITGQAAALHNIDETLLSSTVIRAQLAIGSHAAATDREFGTNSTEAIAVSTGEARIALSDLEVGLDQVAASDAGVDGTVVTAGQDLHDVAIEIIDLLEQGRSREAQDLAVTRLDSAFQALVDVLVMERDRIDEELQRSDLNLGRIGNVARFLVAFIVPTAVILIYRELTRRQQRQGDLERRLEAERTLGKARDEFVANASHELRTPLTSIYGLALLLEEDPAFRESDTAPELLNMIISEAADLSRMVEDLLTTARLDAGALHYTFENVEVTGEVDEVVGPMLRAGVDIAVDCEPGVVRADRLRLRQVLRNLLSNARKYGGPSIRVEGRIEEGKFVATVADDGDGIPPELETRLFQRYIHQGHQPLVLGSVGLGLSIVAALAEGMGGAVGYERREGWTRFSLSMPLVSAAPAAVRSESNRGGSDLSQFEILERSDERYDVGASAPSAGIEVD